MKRWTAFLMGLLLILTLRVDAAAAQYLVPVGKIVGLQLRDDRVVVAAYDDALGANARSCGLKIGDCITAVNGKPVSGADEVRLALEAANAPAELTVLRGSRRLKLTLNPAQTADGPRLGVYLRQGIAGIGTVTWFDPGTGRFGALGHGVNDSAGCLLQMTQGTAYDADILSVIRGRSGHPGQLKGSAEADTPCGDLTRNTPQGVFGKSASGWQGRAIPVAEAGSLHTGSAVILSTVAGDSPREYSVEIVKLYPSTRTDGRNLLLKVTDSALLEATGGIVQGMSGSPIVQDGQLVGAVTHVLVNDPTMGYGIFIGNMLDAAA